MLILYGTFRLYFFHYILHKTFPKHHLTKNLFVNPFLCQAQMTEWMHWCWHSLHHFKFIWAQLESILFCQTEIFQSGVMDSVNSNNSQRNVSTNKINWILFNMVKRMSSFTLTCHKTRYSLSYFTHWVINRQFEDQDQQVVSFRST